MTVTQGKVHEYLGLTLDYSILSKVIIQMDDYIKGILNEAPTDMDGVILTLVVEHLFEVSEDPEYLNLNQAKLFHHLTAKLLFLCKWARPNLQTAVAFLTTRVKWPNMDDYKKLSCMIHYLCGAPNLALTLKADDAHACDKVVD